MDYSVETPQSILDDDGTDVFEEIIASGTYADDIRAQMWARFRYRGIGSCDRDYWVQCMKDLVSKIYDGYVMKFRLWQQFTGTTGEIDLSDGSTEFTDTVKRYDNPDSDTSETFLADKDVRTYSGKSYSGLSSETARKWLEGVPRNPFEDFAREFDGLFYMGV